jgi:hypothetical protein
MGSASVLDILPFTRLFILSLVICDDIYAPKFHHFNHQTSFCLHKIEETQFPDVSHLCT